MATVLCFFTYITVYTVFQEFLIMKLYKVNEKRRQCAVIVFIYTVLFLTLEYHLGTIAIVSQAKSDILIYNICHMIYTFVTITVIGIYAEGFLPRNFIKIFLYYDVLTTLTYGLIIMNLMHLLFEPEQIQGSIYNIESLDQYPIILENWIQLLLVLVITYAVNKKVDMLIKKIPDKICIVILGVSFITYIVKITVSVLNAEFIAEIQEKYDRINMESMISYAIFLVILMIGIGAAILMMSKSRKQYERIIIMETELQREYYRSVADISRNIRELKHDIANHIIVLTSSQNEIRSVKNEEYRSHLVDICERINNNVEKQLAWRSIRSGELSDREKYEIFRYISDISTRYRTVLGKAKIENITCEKETSAAGSPIHTKISIEFRISKLKALLIKRSDMYILIKDIVEINKGNIKWNRENKNALLEIEI